MTFVSRLERETPLERRRFTRYFEHRDDYNDDRDGVLDCDANDGGKHGNCSNGNNI